MSARYKTALIFRNLHFLGVGIAREERLIFILHSFILCPILPRYTILFLSETQANSTHAVLEGKEKVPVLLKTLWVWRYVKPCPCPAAPRLTGLVADWLNALLERQVLVHHVMVTGKAACGKGLGNLRVCSSPFLHQGFKASLLLCRTASLVFVFFPLSTMTYWISALC